MTSVLWSFAAWCALALATERHHEQVFGRPAGTWDRRGWRASALAGLAAALTQAVATQGWALGGLTWVGALAPAGAACVAVLAWAPRHCLPAAVGAVLLGTAQAVFLA